MTVETICLVLARLGWLVLLFQGFKMAYRLYLLLKLYGFGGKEYSLGNCGRWAVVTGATDGIGRQFAEQLAAKGLNIVLVSRSPSKLADVAAAIRTCYAVDTRTIAVDLTGSASIYSDIKRQVEDLDVGVLVNNVGIMAPLGDFLDIPEREKWSRDMLHCNCLAMTCMTSLLLPLMHSKKCGLIINIASLLGELPSTSAAAMYSSTKSYVLTLSRCLHFEYASQGVTVKTLFPGLVMTALAQPVVDGKSVPVVPQPASYVRSALATLAKSNDTTGHVVHQLMYEFAKCLPDVIWSRVAAYSRRAQLASNQNLRSTKS